MRALGSVIVSVFAATLSNPSASERIPFTEALLCIKNLGYNHRMAQYWYHTDATIDIGKKHLSPGRVAPPEWMRSIRGVRDTPVADYTMRGVNTTRRVAYRPPIAVSPCLPALSVSYFKQTVWRCGQL